MNCTNSLEIPVGVTSVVGSGGKTTLLRALSDELTARGHSVILTTTTHIMPFEGIELVSSPDEVSLGRALAQAHVACVGSFGENGKFEPSLLPVERLAELADHVLVEADGSKRLPLKAHASYEPVVPSCSARCVLVVGASGFSRPVSESVHRPELFCARADCAPDDLATPELVARVITRECQEGLLAPDVVVVNQAEGPERLGLARRLVDGLRAEGLELPVWAGSIRNHDLQRVG
jgi:probable selenium-dependent hydroxylase accessory protein YqeC